MAGTKASPHSYRTLRRPKHSPTVSPETAAPKAKAAGPTGVVAKMLKAAGETGMLWMTEVCNAGVKNGRVPEDWSRSWMVNVYKGKGDALICGSYRDIKLLEHAMKVLESD